MDLKERISAIPHTSGIYLMRDASGRVIYVGKAKDLNKRVGSYFRGVKYDPKTLALLSNVRMLDYLITGSERESLVLENTFIKRYLPKYNISLRDGKTYPYLKLTAGEDYPRIFFARQAKKDGSRYFGPYPNIGELKKVIGWILKVFPLRYCKKNLSSDKAANSQYRECLYFHMKQCPAPCIGGVSKEEYRKTVDKLVLFLEGRYGDLRQLWEEEMKDASRKMEYERAAETKENIRVLDSMFEKIRFRRLQKETELAQELEASRALSTLKYELKLPRVPLAIEAFDISDISGEAAVGSMVRFSNGTPDRKNYRKYRIRTVKGADDYSMLSEVVARRYGRLLREGSALPDMVLIDGGKGQLSRIIGTMKSLGLKNLPLASIAKENETIFVPEGKNRFRELSLPYSSQALQLVRHIRDEAHRFALNYHKVRRKREFFGEKTAEPSTKSI